MLEFRALLNSLQTQAIANKLSPTEVSLWRSMCREYSQKFHTPLHLVLEMAPEDVVINIYESQLEPINARKWENLERILETLSMIEDPDYDTKKEKKLQDEIATMEREEEERLEKKTLKSLSKKSLLEKEETKDLPKEGFVDLSYFKDENLTNEDES
jgi:hypothetical protein